MSFADRFRVMEPKDFMNDSDRKKIHDAALNVLETTGIKVHSSVARESLKRAGAVVDEDTNVVKCPADLVGALLKKIPSKIVLAGRTEEYDLPLDRRHQYHTTDGCGISVWNDETKTRRKSTLEDIRKTAVLGDWMPYLSIYEPMVVAHDISSKSHVLKGLETAMENTTKHIETESTTTPEEARAQVEMAAAVVGSKDELKERHYLSAMVCTVSPLILDEGATDAAMVWAENHVPVHITGMASMGLTGPATIAGSLVVNHVETMALACAMQAHEPGSPLLYGSVQSSMDPKTGAYNSGSPETILISIGNVEMAKFLDLPCSAGGIGGSSRIPGLRVSIENSVLCSPLITAGSEVMNGIGLADGSTLLSYEQMMLDHEIVGLAINSQKDIEVSDEAISLDLIKKVGIGRNYLSEMHTLKRVREFYLPTLWDMSSFESWVEGGKKDLFAAAGEKAEKIISSHMPEKLDASVSNKLKQIVKDF
ncbi:MAG: trimethylamine methyltransferase family protein [Methanobacteriota archaeon]|nr:MAG: trimethylamine methyltransferase family protein [Euryarchaeota archaeon]